MLQPLPPDPIPTTPPTQDLRPAPAMPAADWKAKPLIRSKTIITIAGTVIFFALSKFFGIDVDWKGIVGDDGVLTVYELIFIIGGIIAAWFRKVATGPISGITKTKEG